MLFILPDIWSSLLCQQKNNSFAWRIFFKKSLEYKKQEVHIYKRLGSSHLQNQDVHTHKICKFGKFSRFQNSGSSHLQDLVHTRKIQKFTFTEFRSSEGCCITKHEKSEVHFERKRSSHYYRKFTSNKKTNTTQKFNSKRWNRKIFSEVHLPPSGSLLTSVRKFTPRIEVHI